jgi:hypothetical protein
MQALEKGPSLTNNRRLLARHLLIYVFFLGLALLLTWPAVLTPVTRVMGGTTGDNFEMLRNIWWFKFALQTGQPLYYQTYLGYPQGFSSLILAANQLQYLPAYLFAFVMPLTLAYNLSAWLTLALNGWAMTVLMRDLLGEDAPALLAGTIFASAPTLMAHLAEGHAGLIVIWPLPLFVWALRRMLDARPFSWRWALAALVFFNLTPSGHMLQVIYVLMPLLACWLLRLLWQRDWARLRRFVLFCLAAGGFMLLFLLPMIRDTLATSAYVDAGGVVRYSADLLAAVTPSFNNPGWAHLPWSREVLGTNMAEGSSYIGIVAALLALLAAWKRPEGRWWLLLAALAWLLSLGSLLKVQDTPVLLDLGDFQTYLPLPWALVQDAPGFSLARTPGRFNFVQAFALAVLAGYGAAVVWHWLRTRPARAYAWRPALAVLAVLVVGDTWWFASFPTRDSVISPRIAELASRYDLNAAFSVPWDHLLAAKDTLYLQTAHEKPLIAGQITRQTPVDPAMLNVLQASLDPALLRAQGADLLIFHKNRAQETGQLEDLRQKLRGWGAPYYEDDLIAIYEVPAAAAPTQDFTQAAPGGEFSQRYISDFYTTSPGWVDFSATLRAEDRAVSLLIDGVPFNRFVVSGQTGITIPLPVDRPGFHRLEIRVEDPCPAIYPATLRCRSLAVDNPTLAVADRDFIRPQIPYENGVTLIAATTRVAQQTLEVRLWWSFDEPIDAERHVRFVHLLDASQTIVAQVDGAIGSFEPGLAWLETVRIPLDKVASGDYSVRVGWYSFPDLVRFAVLDSTMAGAESASPQIGQVRLP